MPSEQTLAEFEPTASILFPIDQQRQGSLSQVVHGVAPLLLFTADLLWTKSRLRRVVLGWWMVYSHSGLDFGPHGST